MCFENQPSSKKSPLSIICLDSIPPKEIHVVSDDELTPSRADTLARWYLVQVSIDDSDDSETKGSYFVIFCYNVQSVVLYQRFELTMRLRFHGKCGRHILFAHIVVGLNPN